MSSVIDNCQLAKRLLADQPLSWCLVTALLTATVPAAAQWQCTGPDGSGTYLCQVKGGYYSTLAAGQRTDGATGVSVLFALDSSVPNSTWNLQNNSGTLIFYSGGTLGSALGTEQLRIDGAGNVGIGASVPAAGLTVNKPAIVGGAARRNLVLVDNTASAQGVGGGISFGGYYGSTYTNDFANIWGLKENGNANDYAGALGKL